MKRLILLAAAAATFCSSLAFADPPSAGAAAVAAKAAPAVASSHVMHAPDGRFVTTASTRPTMPAQPQTLLVTGGKPVPPNSREMPGGQLQRIPIQSKYGDPMPAPTYVQMLRTWTGAPVSEPVQFRRGNNVFQYTPMMKSTPQAPIAGREIRAEAAKIQKMNDFAESHRINGQEVVWGANKSADGTLTPVRLTPGTPAYKTQLFFQTHRINGAPPLVNAEGKVVYSSSPRP